MELLRELLELQHEHGYLSDEVLRQLAARRNLPLYRLEELASYYPHFRRTPPPRRCVQVCRDAVCALADAGSRCAELKRRLTDRDDVQVETVSCLGRCDSSPAVAMDDDPLAPLTLANLDRILLLVDGDERPAARPQVTSPRRFRCDPYQDPSEHYSAVRALAEAGGGDPKHRLEMLKNSVLRGMGGAGFLTGRKWDLVLGETRQPKYIICNADESEPGTFKDRVILHELPHLVIEGIILAGLTVGAKHTYAC